jgi:adenylate cyclase class IV
VYAERIRQTLKGKGFDLFGITERGVSLSDVYMSFAGRDFRAADEAARLDASTKKQKPKRRSSLES